MKKTVIKVGNRTKEIFAMIIQQFQDPFYQGVAAQIAFSLFLSIIPIIILLSQLLGLFSLSLYHAKVSASQFFNTSAI